VKLSMPDDRAMLADPRRALRVSGFLLLAALVLYLLMWFTSTRDVLQWFDDRVYGFVPHLRASWAVSAAKSLDFLGGTWCSWTLRVLVFAVLIWRRHWLHLAAFLLAVITSEALIGTTKALIDRPRPPGSLIGTSGASFPSGHAVAAAVTAVGVVIALLPAGHTRWVWERRAALYVSVIAMSRVFLGAHWATDVLAGALLGSGIAIGWPALLVCWRTELTDRPSPAEP